MSEFFVQSFLRFETVRNTFPRWLKVNPIIFVLLAIELSSLYVNKGNSCIFDLLYMVVVHTSAVSRIEIEVVMYSLPL